MLAKALPHKIVKVDGDADGRHEATQHLLEFLFLPHVSITRALKSKPVLWAVKTGRLARWYAALDKAGLDWSPCSVHELAMRISVADVPDDERVLDIDDVYLGDALDDIDAGNQRFAARSRTCC